MKKIKNTLLLIVITINSIVIGQVNLVPNGSFEENNLVSTCRSLLDSVNHWFSPTAGTPDYSTYFEFCSIPNSINNTNGFQLPKDGLSYVGFYTEGQPTREYLAINLISPLQSGKEYYLEFYLSLANECKYAVKSIGAYFTSDISGFETITTNIPIIPQIESGNVFLTDTMNWIKISGTYNAVGGETILVIGNFKSQNDTELEIVNHQAWWESSYYFIDDVSLILMNDVGLNELNDDIEIYPNPFDEVIYLKFPNEVESDICLYSINLQNCSQYVNSEMDNNGQIKINTENLPAGFYILTVNNSVIKKLIKY